MRLYLSHKVAAALAAGILFPLAGCAVASGGSPDDAQEPADEVSVSQAAVSTACGHETDRTMPMMPEGVVAAVNMPSGTAIFESSWNACKASVAASEIPALFPRSANRIEVSIDADASGKGELTYSVEGLRTTWVNFGTIRFPLKMWSVIVPKKTVRGDPTPGARYPNPSSVESVPMSGGYESVRVLAAASEGSFMRDPINPRNRVPVHMPKAVVVHMHYRQ